MSVQAIGGADRNQPVDGLPVLTANWASKARGLGPVESGQAHYRWAPTERRQALSGNAVLGSLTETALAWSWISLARSSERRVRFPPPPPGEVYR